jgi:hypothetical protein
MVPGCALRARDRGKQVSEVMVSICAVCSAPCRGICSKCGARLCVRHKQSSARSCCQACPISTSRSRRFSRRGSPPPVQPTVYYVPPSQRRKSVEDMTASEAAAYFADLHSQVAEMKQFQAAYLDRRAQRGANTPTDMAYRKFQVLLEALLALLEELRQASEDQL